MHSPLPRGPSRGGVQARTTRVPRTSITFASYYTHAYTPVVKLTSTCTTAVVNFEQMIEVAQWLGVAWGQAGPRGVSTASGCRWLSRSMRMRKL